MIKHSSTCTHTHTPTTTHISRKHELAHTPTHARTHSHIYIYIYIHTHTHSRTYTHALTNVHTRTRTQGQLPRPQIRKTLPLFARCRPCRCAPAMPVWWSCAPRCAYRSLMSMEVVSKAYEDQTFLSVSLCVYVVMKGMILKH